MASFEQAIGKTLLFEGGYSNRPNDSGGETYRGISRKNFPNWEGWTTVDAIIRQAIKYPPTQLLDRDASLQASVVTFYRTNFWVEDNVTDQDTGTKIFDLSVNVGKFHAFKIAQIASGITADGHWGPKTEQAINAHPYGSLLPLIRIGAENYHKAIVQTHPEDAEFLAGWLRRDDA